MLFDHTQLCPPEKVEVYDSTLRDGAQAEGVNFSVRDKRLIAERLDKLGVHCIEGGWPNSTNPIDTEFFQQVKSLNLCAKVSAFGSTRKPVGNACDDATLRSLLDSETEVIALFGKTWMLHVRDVLRTDADENLRMIESSVAYLVGLGREVVYDAEHFFDGYKNDPEYAVKTLKAAISGGARIVVLCDTNGGTQTLELAWIIDCVKKHLGGFLFGIHTHNDTGMAEANTSTAVLLGATQIQGTFNGYGERCGNANLCTVLPNLEFKHQVRTIGPENLGRLMEFSRYLSEMANVAHDHRQPWVGESAFAHKGGAHADAARKNPVSFEHEPPEKTGNERRILVSGQAGTSTVVQKLDHLYHALDKRDPRVVTLLHILKQREHEGWMFEAAEATFEILARHIIEGIPKPFKLEERQCIDRKIILPDGGEAEVSDAIVKLWVNGNFRHFPGTGDGPVNALDLALRRALLKAYSCLESVRLEDYKVRVLNGGGTASKVRVLIEASDGTLVWSTVGVSTNVIEASWLGLVDMYWYKLLLDGVEIAENHEFPKE